MNYLQHINELVAANSIDEALNLANEALKANPDDDGLLFARGKIHWRKGHRSEAMGDFLQAISINPESPAKIALQQLEDIREFFNPDLLNP